MAEDRAHADAAAASDGEQNPPPAPPNTPNSPKPDAPDHPEPDTPDYPKSEPQPQPQPSSDGETAAPAAPAGSADPRAPPGAYPSGGDSGEADGVFPMDLDEEEAAFLTDLDALEATLSASRTRSAYASLSLSPTTAASGRQPRVPAPFPDWIAAADFVEAHARMPRGTRYYRSSRCRSESEGKADEAGPTGADPPV
ncbi:hypothetical protein GGS23DRAFT_594437 [Durotheca rogersii]|uniref:uncharacterized protein n=1 Tax=Durotheca rogersii TaxID=419775 RepID=UPI00221F9C2C|nr:uncharacterized protein GGS23DRAFT_594437 [Durotheca rogersii]KAI5866306.1 hypothetical protein GGS23DRAFT_594437 [Durotheca rogersii]